MCITCGCHPNENIDSATKTQTKTKTISLEEKILQKNDQLAKKNRDFFLNNTLITLNLLSSPGSGKTTLLEKTLHTLLATQHCYVIEGDQHTDQDAIRIRATGANVVQINTGKGCHLDAHHILHGIEELSFNSEGGYLFIENVGNLVCPASFDLGEEKKVVILSVTEGDDKPIKYPDMFHAADLMIINKIDLLPYVDFDIATCINHAHRINPSLKVIELSATTSIGMEKWHLYLQQLKLNKFKLS
mgnify:CR=1 FL=1